MKRTHLIRFAGALAALMALALVGSTVLAAGRPANAGQAAADVLAYWTPERIAGATPRDIERDTPPGLIDTNPGNGKGGGKPGGGDGGDGGDGGSTTVTGDPWSEVGLVQKTTGRAYFTMGSSNYVCSASVVDDGDGVFGGDADDRSLVLTAGHCVYDDARDAFATNWLFIPDYDNGGSFTNGTGPYGMWVASALVTTTAWAATDFDHDYAFAVFGTNGAGGAGLTLEEVVGEQAIGFSAIDVGAQVHAFGYPAEGKFKGNDLIYCAGPLAGLDPYDDTTADGTTHYIACDMNGGSSGGPWFTGFDETTGVGTVSSLVSYSYRGLKGALFGPRFGAYAAATHTAAKTATANTLVAP